MKIPLKLDEWYETGFAVAKPGQGEFNISLGPHRVVLTLTTVRGFVGIIPMLKGMMQRLGVADQVDWADLLGLLKKFAPNHHHVFAVIGSGCQDPALIKAALLLFRDWINDNGQRAVSLMFQPELCGVMEEVVPTKPLPMGDAPNQN